MKCALPCRPELRIILSTFRRRAEFPFHRQPADVRRIHPRRRRRCVPVRNRARLSGSRLADDKGLPQNWVSSIAQNADGYLWVGTRYGRVGAVRRRCLRFLQQQNTAELKDVQV